MGTFVENVNTLAVQLTDSNVLNLHTVVNNAAAITTVSANIVDVQAVAADMLAITALASDLTNVDSVVNDLANIDAVSTGLVNINSVADALININNVAADLVSINDVHTHMSDVTSTATNIADVVDVSSNMLSILDVTTQIIPNLTEILAADSNAATATSKATESQLSAWIAEANKLTADSYATEAEDTFVKVYTSDGDGTFTTTNTAEYSSLHWAAKATTLITTGVIDDTVPKLDRAYSSSKTQELHDAQAIAIANLASASGAITSSTAPVFDPIPTVPTDMYFSVTVPSSDASVFTFDDSSNTITFLKDGNYNFFSNVTFQTEAGTGGTITFDVVNNVGGAILGSEVIYVQTGIGNKSSAALNTLLTIGSNGIPSAPLTIKIQTSVDAGTTMNLFAFNSVLARASVSTETAASAMDAALGAIYGGLA